MCPSSSDDNAGDDDDEDDEECLQNNGEESAFPAQPSFIQTNFRIQQQPPHPTHPPPLPKPMTG